MDKTELLNWLSSHALFFSEMCSYFDTEDFDDVSLEDIVEYIEEDGDMYRKYERYFGDEAIHTE